MLLDRFNGIDLGLPELRVALLERPPIAGWLD